MGTHRAELLLESLLLGVAGGVLGLVLAYGAVRALVGSEWVHLPRIHHVSIDITAVAFTLCVSLATSLLFGLIPVFKYARPGALAGLRAGTRSATGSRERQRARGLLVVVQVALALVLLVGSGLMIRTFRSLRQVDPGFYGPAELETMRTGIPETQVKDPDRVVRMEMEILRKIETLPGVSRVAAISDLPLEAGENEPVFVEDKQSTEASIRPIRRFKYVSPGYMAAIGRGLIAGRDFTWDELYNRTPVALVSENMAREIWSDPRAAIGKRIRVTMKDDWRDVIGVVADLRDDGIDQKPPTIVYWPLLLKNFQATPDTAIRGVAYIIRTPRAGSAGLHQEIQAAVASVNPTLPVADVKTLESAYELSLARTSFTLVLLAIAGGMALLLGVVGIYGVISYSVSQRSREVGIRLTLGAPVGDVVALFVRQGLVMSALGAICGLAAALPLAGLMKSLLYEIGPADPLTYLVATAVLVLAAILASYLPARRAAKVDPVAALRAE